MALILILEVLPVACTSCTVMLLPGMVSTAAVKALLEAPLKSPVMACRNTPARLLFAVMCGHMTISPVTPFLPFRSSLSAPVVVTRKIACQAGGFLEPDRGSKDSARGMDVCRAIDDDVPKRDVPVPSMIRSSQILQGEWGL